MTTKQLEDRLLSVEKTGYGHWRVTQQVRGKKVSHTTTNAPAIDRWMDGKGDPEYPHRVRRYFYTYREALASLLNL